MNLIKRSNDAMDRSDSGASFCPPTQAFYQPTPFADLLLAGRKDYMSYNVATAS